MVSRGSVGTGRLRGSQSAGSAGSWWKVQLEKSEPGCDGQPQLPRWMFTFQSLGNEWGVSGGMPLDRGVAGRVLGQHWAAELGRGRGWRRWPHFRYPPARNKPQTISQANFSPSRLAENWAAAKPSTFPTLSPNRLRSSSGCRSYKRFGPAVTFRKGSSYRETLTNLRPGPG